MGMYTRRNSVYRKILYLCSAFLFAGSAYAQEYFMNRFNFSSGMSCMSERKLKKNLVIPDSVILSNRIIPVTYIAPYGFCDRTELRSVSFPHTMMFIGQWAFEGCTSLENVNIPIGVKNIGEGAFNNTNLRTVNVHEGNTYYDSRNNCNGIIETKTNTLVVGSCSTVIPESVVNIGSSAFNGRKIKKISIPQNVASIGDHTFTNCKLLKDVIFEKESHDTLSGVRNIGARAFGSCLSIKELPLPNSLHEIGDQAFFECKNLKKIIIPSNVDSVGINLFGGCSKLSVVVVEEGNMRYDSRNNCNAIIETKSNTLLSGCKDTKIPVGVVVIGRKAFGSVYGLEHVKIPLGAIGVEDDAFFNCVRLKTIELPRTMEYYFDSFDGCKQLRKVIVLAQTPPQTLLPFSDVVKGATLYVPKGNVERYKIAEGWEDFGRIVEVE